ncbi:DUF6602 domain-containing protein [Microbulbifer sp. SSSA008]|uniref:DUF6602 domain-containing protein n=1 Tax=Microbulbifer sp. SSSA008 TaxID=3243380 RepID=UPI004039AEC2
MRKLDIPTIFKSEAEDLVKARDGAIRIHGTGDIKAAGNEIEIHVREFFKRMLPKNLYVTHGHLIDADGVVSPQLDIIIADTSNLPSLMTTKDGSEYIPIDSVYACGEIKSTYYKNSKYIPAFSEVLSKIKNEMAHEDIPNTAYLGKTDGSSLIRDIFLGKENKTLNKIYSFMLFVNSGDFEFSDVKATFKDTDFSHLPNTSVILNSGAIFFGKLDDHGFSYERYPDEIEDKDYKWFFSPFIPTDDHGSLEGNNLGYLYYSILQHISSSYLEPPNLSSYLATMMVGRKSLLQSTNDE